MYDENRPAAFLPCAEGSMVNLVRDTPLRRLLVWLVISAAFTALAIQFSYAHGKLACPPFYDDVAYFEDALHRLEVFHSFGAGAVIGDYIHSPPHSVFSSFLAAGAFAVFGIYDWAPYLANGLIVFALLGTIDFLCRDISPVRRVGVMVFVLCVPISAMTVHEFRPDIPSALCAGIGAALMLWKSLTGVTWRYRVVAGAMFGLGALFKPPTFPLTVVVFFASLGVAVVIDWVLVKPDPQKMLMAIVQCSLAAVLVPLPHFLLDWRATYVYIYTNIFGESHSTWARQGTALWHVRYYFDGPGGATMAGAMAWPLVILAVGGLGVFVFLRRREQAVRVGGLLVVALAAYGVPTLMDVKEPFFGTTFVWVLIFAAVYVLGEAQRWRGWIPVALLVVACGVGLRALRLGPNLCQRGSPIVRERNRLVNDIYAALYREQFPYFARVYMTTTGFVNVGVLDYYYRRDTLHALNIDANQFSDDLAAHAREIGCADYVIASEAGNGEAYGEFVKSGLVQDETLAIVRNNADFQQIGAYPTLTGKHYYLFRRINPFCGWISPTGLIPVPAEKGKRVTTYVAIGDVTKLVIPANGPAKLRFVGKIAARVTPLKIRFKIDGRGERLRILNDAGTPEVITFSFTLHGGGEHTVEIRYDPPADPGHPILFTQLEIIPDEQK